MPSRIEMPGGSRNQSKLKLIPLAEKFEAALLPRSQATRSSEMRTPIWATHFSTVPFRQKGAFVCVLASVVVTVLPRLQDRPLPVSVESRPGAPSIATS